MSQANGHPCQAAAICCSLAVIKVAGWSPSSTSWLPGLPGQGAGTGSFTTASFPVPWILSKFWENSIPAPPSLTTCSDCCYGFETVWNVIQSVKGHSSKRPENSQTETSLLLYDTNLWVRAFSFLDHFLGDHIVSFIISFHSTSFPFTLLHSATPWPTSSLNYSLVE